MCVWFLRSTLRMAMSRMTGALIVVMRRRMAAMKKKATPTLAHCQYDFIIEMVEWTDQ